MKRIAPEDAKEIDGFTDLIKKFTGLSFNSEKPPELMGFGDFINMMKQMKPFMKDFSSLGKLSIRDYSTRFTNPNLREAFVEILGIPEFSLMAIVFMLSWQHTKEAGYPIGGSLNFSRNIEKKYLALGGTIQYGKTVDTILTEKNRAVGIRLSDGSEHRADIIVSAADGYTTIFKMLSGKYVNGKIRKNYETLPLFKPMYCLSLGVKRDFSNEPIMAMRILKTPLIIEGKTQSKIGIKHFCFDPTMAPKGKSVLEIMYSADYGYWSELKKSPRAYSDEKGRIAQQLISGLEEFYPGIKEDIEIISTATPVTWERYTGNRGGTIEGWLLTPKTLMLRIKKTLPGLKNFYMAGQWVQPGGGIPTSLKSGRDLVYILCKKDRREFLSR